jgi:hypothetical protein
MYWVGDTASDAFYVFRPCLAFFANIGATPIARIGQMTLPRGSRLVAGGYFDVPRVGASIPSIEAHQDWLVYISVARLEEYVAYLFYIARPSLAFGSREIGPLYRLVYGKYFVDKSTWLLSSGPCGHARPVAGWTSG